MTNPVTVLLTNDDGIDAPGIGALESAFQEFSEVELWTVAPALERSTTSHAMTLSRPVFAEDRGLRRFAVDGMPADCVYLALFGLMKTQPNVVVSGINNGPNLGCDVIYSGTVAGAREGVIRGIHGVAASLVSGSDFEPVAKSVAEIALQVAARPLNSPLLLNLNYPSGNWRDVRFGPLGGRHYPHVVNDRIAPLTKATYYWLGGPPVRDKEIENSDGWLIGQGYASATFLSTDQTDTEKMNLASTLVDLSKGILER